MGVFCGQSAGFGQFVHKEGVFCGLCGFEPFRPQRGGVLWTKFRSKGDIDSGRALRADRRGVFGLNNGESDPWKAVGATLTW